MDFLNGKKTYTVAIAAALSALGMYLSGDATIAEAVTVFLTGAGFATLRHGISKTEN